MISVFLTCWGGATQLWTAIAAGAVFALLALTIPIMLVAEVYLWSPTGQESDKARAREPRK